MIARIQLIFISWWRWRCGSNQARHEIRWLLCEAGITTTSPATTGDRIDKEAASPLSLRIASPKGR